jgi:hypothetical protein
MKNNLYYHSMLLNQQIYFHQTFYQINNFIYKDLNQKFIHYLKNRYFRQNLIIIQEHYLFIYFINLFIIHNFK